MIISNIKSQNGVASLFSNFILDFSQNGQNVSNAVGSNVGADALSQNVSTKLSSFELASRIHEQPWDD